MFIALSIYVLYRGHNQPGGGFIGGLLAASGYVYYMMAFDVESALKKMIAPPFTIIATGLTLAFSSGFLAIFNQQPFMTGKWISILGIKLGTPTLFDIGVYFTVLGVLVSIMSAILDKEKSWH